MFVKATDACRKRTASASIMSFADADLVKKPMLSRLDQALTVLLRRSSLINS